MRIWKWPLVLTDRQTLMLPAASKILTVQMQYVSPQLWALCDARLAEFYGKTPRHIAIYGTGNPMPDDPGEYIATFQMEGGALVWHAFEIKGTS